MDSAEVDASLAVQVIDLDYETDPAVIAALKEKGIRTICYISVGSWEDWRPDADQFPAKLLGKRYRGWQGERWLDIRRLDLLAPLLQARMDQCQQSGFNGIEPDNMDIASNVSGFPITYADQLAFAQWLAQEAHARGLAIGQKNGPEMTAELVDVFDFAISEDCFAQGWCEELLPYINAGKAVFAVEYTDTDVDFPAACRWATQTDFSFILKNRDLDAWMQNCEDALK
ncbi:MAG: endo alpha-1,4 polygalactosaminidase [Anaerolineaceae bacterium]|nr:endo alpha-1,4 polygalactosaminidase [Anaerolineaceae bacterium]